MQFSWSIRTISSFKVSFHSSSSRLYELSLPIGYLQWQNQVFQEKTIRFFLFFMQVLWLCRQGSKKVVAFTERINTLAFSEKGEQ